MFVTGFTSALGAITVFMLVVFIANLLIVFNKGGLWRKR